MSKLSAQDLKKMLDEKEDFVLLDVREYADFLQGHIPGAKNITIEELGSHLGKLDKAKLIVVYCSGPACPLSGFAMEKLEQAGFNVKHFNGGMEEWTSKKYPVKT